MDDHYNAIIRRSKARQKRRRNSHKRNCYGKIRHRTREDAQRVARAMSSQEGIRYQAYRCLNCRKYHVGSSASGRAQRALNQISREHRAT